MLSPAIKIHTEEYYRQVFIGLDGNTVSQMNPAGETVSAWIRRRRSNRPGNSQANGPQEDVTLESRWQVSRLTEGVNPQARG